MVYELEQRIQDTQGDAAESGAGGERAPQLGSLRKSVSDTLVGDGGGGRADEARQVGAVPLTNANHTPHQMMGCFRARGSQNEWGDRKRAL
jgi:hypothetical protein